MLKVSLNGLWAHKRRLVGTFLAVFLGVAFLSGTLVLGDTLRANFDSLFTSVTGDTAAVVRNSTKVNDSPATPRGPIPASLADRLRAVPGVGGVRPVAAGLGQIVGSDGKVVTAMGPPLAGTWIGDRTVVQTPRRVPVTVVGIATFQGADGFGGSSYVGFTLQGAQRHLLRRPDQVSSILVRAAPGVSEEE